MFEKFTEEETRAKCKAAIESLEKWLRNLVDLKLSATYGSNYHDYVDEKSNRLIKGAIVKSCNEKIRYESVNMAKEYNVPSVTSYSDSLGNKIHQSQFISVGAIKLISKDKLARYKLYPGDAFQARVDIDDRYDTSSYLYVYRTFGYQ